MRRAIDLLREGHRAFNDYDLDALGGLFHPDIEWQTTGRFVGLRSVYRGVDGVAEWTQELKDAWESFDVRIVDVVFDHGHTCGVVEEVSGRGRASGVEVELELFTVYRVADGKLARRENFPDRAALEAAGDASE